MRPPRPPLMVRVKPRSFQKVLYETHAFSASRWPIACCSAGRSFQWRVSPGSVHTMPISIHPIDTKRLVLDDSGLVTLFGLEMNMQHDHISDKPMNISRLSLQLSGERTFSQSKITLPAADWHAVHHQFPNDIIQQRTLHRFIAAVMDHYARNHSIESCHGAAHPNALESLRSTRGTNNKIRETGLFWIYETRTAPDRSRSDRLIEFNIRQSDIG